MPPAPTHCYVVPGAPVTTTPGAPYGGVSSMTHYVVPGAPSGTAYGLGVSGSTVTTATTPRVSGAAPNANASANGSGAVPTRGRGGKRPRGGGGEDVDADGDDAGGGGGRGRRGRGAKEARGADAKAEADGKSGGVNVTTTGKRRTKTTTLPTADEIPTLTPVDVSSLPEDVRRYREERAKHWPSDENVKAKREAESTEEARRAKEMRRERLKEILAKQREMGHFEASQEIGNDGEGVVDSGAGAEAKNEEVDADETKTRKDATKVCRFWLQGGCRKGDACDFKHESTPNSGQKCRFFARGRCKAGARCPFRHEAADAGGKTVADAAGNPGNPQTLLKKLLNKEIKRDESRLLQLFRFFVNNDFLSGAKGREEPFWMFPWVDDAVVDKRAATLATLPPVEDDPEDDDPASAHVVPRSEEKESPSANPRPDMGFFSAYDSEDEDEDDDEED